MCNHSQIINRLRELLFEIQACQSAEKLAISDYICSCSSEGKPDQQAVDRVPDQLEVCALMDGCDITR